MNEYCFAFVYCFLPIILSSTILYVLFCMHSQETCSGCEELRKWGIEMERMANTKGDRVDQLEGLLHNCKCSSLKKSKSDSSSCQCEILQSKLQTQRAELADRKAEIVKLKMLQEMKNKPLEDTIRQLENKLKLSEQKVCIIQFHK